MDEERTYVLGKGRLTYEGIRPPRHLGYRYSMGAKSFRAYAELAEVQVMRYRIFFICGYDPQMLLPAPPFEREIRQTLTEWAAEQRETPFADAIFNRLTLDGEVIFSPTGRYIEDPMSSAAHLLADAMTRIIKAMTPREAPVLVVGADFGAVEAKALSYMYATFIHESELGSPTPRGRIEIFDYEGGTVMNLEGEGELPGLIDESFWLKTRYPPRYRGPKSVIVPIDKPTKQNGRSNSYLDHDPTKRHKRRKQRGNPHKR